MSYVDPANDWIPEVARAALDAEYNRPNSWAEFAAQGSEAAQAEVELWKRLANDHVMRDVYENLEAVPGFDEHWLEEFLDAAWGSRLGDLDDLRKRRDRMMDLVPEIGEKALELKALLDQIDGSLMVPSELLGMVSLLRSAEQYQETPWASSWQGGVGHSALDSIDPNIWDGAPTVPNLLKAMADAAEGWKKDADAGELPGQKPSSFHNPVLEAAIGSDKSTERTQYLRALVASLRDRGLMVREGNPPTALKRAIVYVSNVVLGYTDVEQHGRHDDALLRALSRIIKAD